MIFFTRHKQIVSGVIVERKHSTSSLLRLGLFGFLLGFVISIGIVSTLKVQAVDPGVVKNPSFTPNGDDVVLPSIACDWSGWHCGADYWNGCTANTYGPEGSYVIADIRCNNNQVVEMLYRGKRIY
jgi:hypothetical protein